MDHLVLPESEVEQVVECAFAVGTEDGTGSARGLKRRPGNAHARLVRECGQHRVRGDRLELQIRKRARQPPARGSRAALDWLRLRHCVADARVPGVEAVERERPMRACVQQRAGDTFVLQVYELRSDLETNPREQRPMESHRKCNQREFKSHV